MTIKDLDSAAIELNNSINAIMATYGLPPTLMYYVLQEAVAAVSGLRVQEYMMSSVIPETPKKEPQETVQRTLPVSDIVREKVKNGDIGEDGKVHISLKEVLKNDSKSSD